MTSRTTIPAWTPTAMALLVLLATYQIWIRPTEQRTASVEQQIRQTRAQVSALEGQIARDRAVETVPLPITKVAFDRQWPDVIAEVQRGGYLFQAVTFAGAAPLSLGATGSPPAGGIAAPTATANTDVAPGPPGPRPARQSPSAGAFSNPRTPGVAAGPPVTPLEITTRLTGSYLALDDTLHRIASFLPLWSWRSLHLSSQQDAADIAITVDAVVPIVGPVAAADTGPARTGQPFAPPPPGPTRQQP